MVQPQRDSMQVVPSVKKRYVILLHGLWMNGLEMGVLANRLRRCGYTPITYPYKDLRFSPAQNAGHLQSWMESLQADEVNFVAHSLGGIVLLHLFARLRPPHDGAVELQETLLPGAKSHIALRTNHMGVLLSGKAARQTCAFLSMGCFQ